MVSIIIVTWNNEKDIQICLESLKNQIYKDFNVILVDNDSKDNTVEIAKETYPSLFLIQQKKNYFLCKSNNDGIKYAIQDFKSEYVIVLNPDTKCDPNLISELKSILDKNTTVAAVGPKIKFFDNKYEGLINSTGLIYDGFIQAYDRGIFEKDLGQYDKAENVTAVSGACIMYRANAIQEAGLYWESLKMYLDELELSIRLRKKGWKIMYNPKAILWHSYMASTNQNKDFQISDQKMKAWTLIALRHYPITRKIAMLKHYFKYKLLGKSPV